MIIECKNCNKKFDIDQNLIPEKGRLLQCSSCNHKWFFKKITAVKIKELPINESIEIFETKNVDVGNDKEINDKASIINKIDPSTEDTDKNLKINKTNIKNNNNFLYLIIVFIITFIALIILLDTFKNPLDKFFPSLEFLLYNLYESIKDIGLFFRDLI